MTGESAPWPATVSPQPGGRSPAPGELALVQAFVNSHYDLETTHGADLLASPAELRDWLLRRGLIHIDDRVGTAELERALAVREGLRNLMGGDGQPSSRVVGSLNRAAVGAGAEVRFTGAGPRFVAAAGGGIEAALGLLLSLAAKAMIDGSWTRLKLCPGRDCGWAFYDHSRNRTGRWCAMSVCGGRAKARAHYRRARGPQ